jgi:hypothetical protein
MVQGNPGVPRVYTCFWTHLFPNSTAIVSTLYALACCLFFVFFLFCVCVCVCVCARARTRQHAWACICASMCACESVRACFSVRGQAQTPLRACVGRAHVHFCVRAAVMCVGGRPGGRRASVCGQCVWPARRGGGVLISVCFTLSLTAMLTKGGTVSMVSVEGGSRFIGVIRYVSQILSHVASWVSLMTRHYPEVG